MLHQQQQQSEEEKKGNKCVWAMVITSGAAYGGDPHQVFRNVFCTKVLLNPKSANWICFFFAIRNGREKKGLC